MSRKILTVLISIMMLVVLLSGCSSNNAGDKTSSGSASTSGSSSASQSEAASVGEKSQGTVKIVFCDDAFTRDYIDVQLPLFTKKTGINVKSDILPAANFYQKMEIGMAAKTQDWDVVQVDISCAGPLLSGNYLQPLDKFITQASTEWSKGYEGTGLLNSFQYNDKPYGIPLFMGTCIMMYNADHFKEVGLDPEKPPKTLDELVEACKVLNRPAEGKNAIVFRASREGETCSFFWSMLYFNQGGSWYPKNHESLAIFDTQAAKNAAKYFVELGKYAPEGILNYIYTDCTTAIQQGKASIWVDVSQCASWTIDPKLSTVSDAMRFAAFDGHCLGASWNFAIGANTDVPDLAWKTIEYLTGYDVSWEECKGLKMAAPCRVDILKNPELNNIYPESLIAAMRDSQMDSNAIFYPLEAQCGEIVSALAINLSDALAGIITSEEAMSNTQTEVLAIKKRDGIK